MKNYLLMKTHNKFSQMREEQGQVNPVNGTARHRISIGSIASRYSLASLICALMLTLGVGNVWGTTKSETISMGGSAVSGWTCSPQKTYCTLYYSGGKSNDFVVYNNSISNLSSVDFSAVTSPSITINVSGITNNGTNSFTVSLVNSSGTALVTSSTQSNQFPNSSSSGDADWSDNIVLTPTTGVTGIKVSCKAKTALAGVKYSLTYTTGGGGTVTLHTPDGRGSSSTTTQAQSAVLPSRDNVGDSDCEWTFIGWRASEYTGASSAGNIMANGSSTGAGKTDLYAFYSAESPGGGGYTYTTDPRYYNVSIVGDGGAEGAYFMECITNVYGAMTWYFLPKSGYTIDATTPTVTMGGEAVDASKITWNPDNEGYGDLYVNLGSSKFSGDLEFTVHTTSCGSVVTIAKGTESNATLSFSSASAPTCSSTAADRRVTVSVAPNTCYAAPVAASVTSTGTSCTKISGPTWNSGTSKYDYVYEFAKDATGTTTFSVSLSTKTTYTVSYAAGSTTATGGNAISGSHANDTKTCGTNMTLPGASFTTTGYTQTGWSTSDGGTKSYNLSITNYSTDADATLYPYWEVNSYSVTWKVNNTTYSAGGSTAVNHGSHVATLPTAPNPNSYCGDMFVGWTTDADYAHNSSPLYKTIDQFPDAEGDQIFYAVFADFTTE